MMCATAALCTFLQTQHIAASSATGSLRESPKGTYVEGARQVPLRSVGEALQVLARAWRAASPPPHERDLQPLSCDLLDPCAHIAASSGSEAVRTSQLSLVDLAGSGEAANLAGVVDHASRERCCRRLGRAGEPLG